MYVFIGGQMAGHKTKQTDRQTAGYLINALDIIEARESERATMNRQYTTDRHTGRHNIQTDSLPDIQTNRQTYFLIPCFLYFITDPTIEIRSFENVYNRTQGLDAYYCVTVQGFIFNTQKKINASDSERATIFLRHGQYILFFFIFTQHIYKNKIQFTLSYQYSKDTANRKNLCKHIEGQTHGPDRWSGRYSSEAGGRTDRQGGPIFCLTDRQKCRLADRGKYQLDYHQVVLNPDNLQISILYFPRQEDILIFYLFFI